MGYEPLTYESYVYPMWANALGWIIAGSSIAMIPGVAIYKLITTPGTLMQVRSWQSLSWLRILPLTAPKIHPCLNNPPLVSILSQTNPYPQPHIILPCIHAWGSRVISSIQVFRCAFPIYPVRTTCTVYLIPLDVIVLTLFVKLSLCNLPQAPIIPFLPVPNLQIFSLASCLEHSMWQNLQSSGVLRVVA